MSGALASPVLCSGKPEAQVPLRNSRDVAQDGQWLDSCGVLRGAAQGATVVIPFPVCAQGMGRRELKEGQTHVLPCCLSS